MAAQPIIPTADSPLPSIRRSGSGEDGSTDNEKSSVRDILSGTDKVFSQNPFSDSTVAAHYRVIYEQSQYECRHVFDPKLEWTAQEEKKVVRKLDWHVCLWASFMFFALQVDRGNLYQAVSDNFLQELHLTTNDYNWGNTVFLISFVLSELPSQLIAKWVGPERWVPVQMTLWSIVAASQAALSGKASFLTCRALLGVLEGGFVPELVLWLSYFYTSRELPMRLSVFWTSLYTTTILTSLLAFAIFHLDGVHGLSGWRWLFLIEGIITLAVGLASFFFMPASAVQTKTWFRPKGWFTDREIGIVVNRVLRDDPSKGDMHNRQAVTPLRLWKALKDYDLWPIYILGFICFIPETPVIAYLTITLRELGFSTFNTNLLTIPPTAIGIFTLLLLTWTSEKLNERTFVAIIQNLWTLPCLIALRVWKGDVIDPWKTYALVVVLLSYPYCHAILVGWVSKNSGSVRTRSVSAAVYNMCVQLGQICSANIYRTNDAPFYHKGNTALIIINSLSIVCFIVAKVYYVMKNKRREKKWAAMSVEDRKEYIATTKDEGNQRMDFRFAH